MLLFLILVCFSSYASEIELNNLGLNGLPIRNNQSSEEDFFTRVANFEKALVMCDLLKYEDQEEGVFEIQIEDENKYDFENIIILSEKYENETVENRKGKRTIDGSLISNKQIIEDPKIKSWEPLKGQKYGKIVYGGICLKCKQEKWVSTTSDQKKARRILIADFANHNHKYCPNNPNAIRFKR